MDRVNAADAADAGRLNPLFGGSVVWTLGETGAGGPAMGLNPLFGGSVVWTARFPQDAALRGLNPLFGGSVVWTPEGLYTIRQLAS